MDKITDWSVLWRQLVLGLGEASSGSRSTRIDPEDVWRKKAREFDVLTKKRAVEKDPLRDFVASRVNSETTVLDIGAGTGKWVTYLAPRVRRVTALDPSPSMLSILRENLAPEAIQNVEVVQGSWPEAKVEPHDFTICSHAVYSVPDLEPFLRRMIEVTRRTCFLVLKSPVRHGIMAEACLHIWGHPFDGPNFTVAYNVLLDMGVCANVLVDPALWDPWVHSGLEEALGETKRRLKISGTAEHDEFLLDLLAHRLTVQDGKYVWPRGVRSVLVYWDVGVEEAQQLWT